jgi:hypothetical protein
MPSRGVVRFTGDDGNAGCFGGGRFCRTVHMDLHPLAGALGCEEVVDSCFLLHRLIPVFGMHIAPEKILEG